MAWFLNAQSLLQFFYPSYCPSCKVLIDGKEVLCATCVQMIKPTATLHIALTAKHAMRVVSASTYEHAARMLVLKKFSYDMVASKQLATLMLDVIDFDLLKLDVIVPIPLHWTRYAKRGFNQADVMAKILSKTLQVPVVHLIRRKKKTMFQSRLNKAAREKNIADAFGLNDWYGFRDLSFIEGKRIVLVDDLCTTGVTLQQAGKMLLALKPHSITAVVACRAV